MSQPTSERGITYLTPEAYERLSSELNELKTEGRERVSAAIGTAREHGDIRENADYDAAKNEQGMMEARIRQLETLLSSAVVGEVAGASGVAGPGTVVVVEIAGDEETRTPTRVGDSLTRWSRRAPRSIRTSPGSERPSSSLTTFDPKSLRES